MSQIITISPKGQITIPKRERDKLLSSKMLFEKQGNTFVLKPVKIEVLGNDLEDFSALSEKSFEFWNSKEDEEAAEAWINCKSIYS